MKKYILAIFAAAALFSCKKNEQPDTLVTTEANQQTVIPAEDELLKDSQNKLLTNVALSESYFDFGKIKKDETVKHVYEITNTGKNPLIISAVKPGCGCTAPEYTKEPIMPGQKGQITLAFDPTGFSSVVNKEAKVYANIEKSPITLTFSADIQP